MLEGCSSQGRHHELKGGDRQQHAPPFGGGWRVAGWLLAGFRPAFVISFFSSKSGSPSFARNRPLPLAPAHGLIFHTPPMEQPDNPPEVDPEAFEEALWALTSVPQESQQLAIDGVGPDDPVIIAIVNNG